MLSLPFASPTTLFLPLDAAEPLPSSPTFLVPSLDPVEHVKRGIKTLLAAHRVVVVCGAGISVQAGIPDFRSPEGLFRSLKKSHTMLTSGKDLFDASVFTSEDTTSLFYQMIARLSQLSETAEPTPFHRFLCAFNDRGRLLQVYTQNIDALEEKSGLTFGVPGFNSNPTKSRSSKGKAGSADTCHPEQLLMGLPMTGTPKCIPLHGSLRTMHCMACAELYPLCDYIDSLLIGTPPLCPQCAALEETRLLVGKRSHGVGKLHPSIVLYNEEHKNGEAVGDVIRRDSKGRLGADLLLVVGTSLRVPGAKQMVRDFSKAVRSRHATIALPGSSEDELTMDAETSMHRNPGSIEEPPVRTIYVNLDFPMPTREWKGVFDVWVQGDAQVFARMIHEELEKEEMKETAKGSKWKREEGLDSGA